MMPDITTTLQSAFFEHHPQASLLLSHTGSLVLNGAARALFAAHQLPDHVSADALVHLLHADDYQHWRGLSVSSSPARLEHTWRWFVDRDQPTTLTTHITLTAEGSCVVLEHTLHPLTPSTPQHEEDDETTHKVRSDAVRDMSDDIPDYELADIIDLWQSLTQEDTADDISGLSPDHALEHLPYAVFCVDKQWRFRFANTVATASLGVSAADLQGQLLWDIAPEMSQHVMGDYYRAAMTSGQPSYHEEVAHDPPFSGRWHATHLRPFADGLLVTIKDITHRKRSHDNLLAQKAYSDRLLAERNTILASISDYFFIVDNSWRITYANDAIADYLETIRDELIGQSFWEVSALPPRHPLVRHYQHAMDSGQPQHIEVESTRFPGTYLDVHLYPYESGLVIYGRDISERKRLEHRLTQALEDKEAILHSISDMMVSLDAKWRFSYANARAQAYLPADYLGRHYFDVYPHNRSSIYEQYYQQVFDTGQTVTFEAQASVSGRWLEYRVYPHRGGIVIYAQNIDERKRLAAQLERTLSERDAFLDNISEGMVSLDKHWRLTYANRYARQYLPADYLGTSYWDIFPANRGSIFEEKYQQAFDTGEPVTFEAHASRSGRWLEFRVYPYEGGIIINASSIEERRRLQAELEHALAERDAIFDSIIERVSVLDKDLRYVYINKHTRESLSFDIIGRSYPELFPNEHNGIIERSMRQVFATNKPVRFEVKSNIDSTWRDVRIYPSVNGKTITVYSADMSERKQLEQDLQDALAQKDILMKELHHRTKNNLQLVASMLALQARQLEDESAKAALKNSQSRIHTLAEIHTMLYRQDASTLDTASYLQLLATNIIESTSQAPVRLECDLAAIDLPLEHTIALGLIANELITNTLKYAFAHTSNQDNQNQDNQNQEATIWLQLEHHDNTITMTVRNNGVPLTENRSDSLGMTIIQALTEQLDGQFTMQNVANGVLAQVAFTLDEIKG